MITRPDVTSHRQRDGLELGAHVFTPTEPAAQLTTVAFFHPGGFTMGDPSWGHRFAAAHLELGHTFVSLAYRHAGDGVTIDEQVADAIDGLRWIREHHCSDDSALVASGHSAGGYLAIAAALESVGAPPVADGVVTLAPVTRISSKMAWLLPAGSDPDEHDLAARIGPDVAPSIHLHGSADDLVPFAGTERLVEMAAAAGAQVELRPIGGADHFFNSPRHAEAAHTEMANGARDLAACRA